ncbi:SAM-dependent methyltransferase [Massilia sp. PWRC2]|uniref:SAM-dependent methyltransferase n=1 Tax=Massilia sp. PWRC2 TaxID=2804626 RepID=UPI003CEE25CD
MPASNPASASAHFEALYAASDDPWQVRASWYEQRKRAVLLACLDRPHYQRVFEPGCGNGELSAALLPRCQQLLACDGAASAVAAARRRLAGAGIERVGVEQCSLPADWPLGQWFDLIIISELAYYFDGAGLAALVNGVAACLADGGLLVLCHWRHDFADRSASTEQLHAAFASVPRLQRHLFHADADFLLETFSRSSSTSATGAAS